MTELIYGGLLGLVAGLAFNRIAVFQVKKRVIAKLKKDTDSGKLSEAELAEARTDADIRISNVSNVVISVVWALISAILFAVMFHLTASISEDVWVITAKRLEYMAYISLCGAIAAVDLDIRKIPNLSVLALLMVRTAAIIFEMIKGGSVKEVIFPSLIGLAAGFILFQLPTFFKIPIGVGDIKFAAAIGYCMGIFGLLESALVMAVGLVVLLVFLLATKKGDRKTPVPMGPFLAAGAILSIVFPVFNSLSESFFANLF